MGELGGRLCMLILLLGVRASVCYLCWCQRLVLFSGSHGERCLPLAVMLLILMLRRGCPEAQDTSWAAQRRAAKMALVLLVCYIPLEDYFLRQSLCEPR